jgi:PKD repeat protein
MVGAPHHPPPRPDGRRPGGARGAAVTARSRAIARATGRAPWSRTALAIAVTLLVALPASAGTASLLRGAIAPLGSAHVTLAQGPVAAPPAGASSRGAVAGIGCAPLEDAWDALYGSGPAPPAVAGSSEPGCVPGPDEEGVTLASTSPGSASQFEVSVTLPSTTSSSPSTLSEFWISLVVRGLPCSLGGESVLRLDLLPPDSPLGSANGWALDAPLWGLTPAGSCDPRCQNTSAIYDLGITPFCLDNTLLAGIGAPDGPVPIFSGGDSIRFTFTNGSGHGLTVYANDSTRPVLSTEWSYNNKSLFGGAIVEPFEGSAAAESAWTFGGAVAFGWTNCPTEAASGLPSCDSYDGAVVGALSFPSVTNSTFWNASVRAYSNRYSLYDPWSSSGACSGDLNLTSCFDFSGSGGSGAYPSIEVVAGGGAAWISYGSTNASVVGPVSTSGSPFGPNGTASPNDPGRLTELSAAVNSTAIILSARATDPRAVDRVQFSALWCFSGGSSTTPTALVYNATRAAGASNGSEDAFWNYSFPRGNNATGGTVYYSATEYFAPDDPGTLPVYARATVPSGGLVCSAPMAPPVLPLRASAISDGYEVQWIYPAAPQTAYVRNFSIVATPPTGPAVVEPYPVRPNEPSVVTEPIVGLSPGTNYSVTVHTTQVNGGLGPTIGTSLPGPATLRPLTVNASAAFAELVEPSVSETFNATATGGEAPYSYAFELGNGTTLWSYRQAGGASVRANYSGFQGVLEVTVVANDSLGDNGASAPLFVDVRATPQGVSLHLATGADFVGLSWAPPVSPTDPVTGYTVFYSSSAAALSVFTSAWPRNQSAPPSVLIWNTSKTWFNFSGSDGVDEFAEVIAWNAWGAGLAPSAGPSFGVPAPFDLVGFGPSPGTPYGGAAPFTASLSASTSSGTFNNLTSAIFTATEISPVFRFVGISAPGALAWNSAGNASYGWANASLTFNESGTYLVEVHLDDALADPELIESLDLYVGAGASPSANLQISTLTEVPFAGTPVDFHATASGTPGPYNYSWLFGDGNQTFDAGPSVSHVYRVAGFFTAVLTVVDNSTGGIVSVDQLVDVNAYPQVRISASAGTGGDLSWTFQAIEIGGSGPPLLNWAFGDGTSGSGQSASHTYAKAGEYTVRVTLTDPAGIPTVSSNLTLYAGLPPSAPPSNNAVDAAIGVIVLLGVAVLLLAVLTVWYYRRSRRPPSAPGPLLYPKDREPPALPPPE